MRVISFNANGIRASYRRGFFTWLLQQNADVICLQELKAQAEDMQAAAFQLPGYAFYFHAAEKKGYSGVAVLSKKRPKNITYGCGKKDIDIEGRVLKADFNNISICNSKIKYYTVL